MSKTMKDAVIVACGRSAIGRSGKGSLRNTHPVDFAGQVLAGVLNRIPQLDKSEVEDVIVGCANPFNQQGANFARQIVLRAGLPYEVCGQTVNRFCSSGLQTISTAANMIMTGQAEVMVAGGVESMSSIPMNAGGPDYSNPWLKENEPGVYTPMGITAENVAVKYNVSRADMEAFAVDTQQKAAKAMQEGFYDDQIIPVDAIDDDGNKFEYKTDECPRANTTLEGLAGLKPPFKEDGLVTAGTSSPTSDGASFVVLMSAEKAASLGIRPLARFVGFATKGVDPDIMGIGPIAAVPKLMKNTGLSIDDMDMIELNEAFAAQAIPCIKELKFDTKKVNMFGGALALGHPLGATGAILTTKAVAGLQKTGGKYALITMCIGGGMGAAGIIEKM